VSCGRTQEFLASHKIEAKETLDAKKVVLKEADALKLASEVDEIYAAKGKKVVHLNLKKEKPDKATLLGVLLGPTGNLRAPALKKGRTLIVGFDAETYQKLFG
jgi:arsenate reductase-like glutaredoxin family protein